MANAPPRAIQRDSVVMTGVERIRLITMMMMMTMMVVVMVFIVSSDTITYSSNRSSSHHHAWLRFRQSWNSNDDFKSQQQQQPQQQQQEFENSVEASLTTTTIAQRQRHDQDSSFGSGSLFQRPTLSPSFLLAVPTAAPVLFTEGNDDNTSNTSGGGFGTIPLSAPTAKPTLRPTPLSIRTTGRPSATLAPISQILPADTPTAGPGFGQVPIGSGGGVITPATVAPSIIITITTTTPTRASSAATPTPAPISVIPPTAMPSTETIDTITSAVPSVSPSTTSSSSNSNTTSTPNSGGDNNNNSDSVTTSDSRTKRERTILSLSTLLGILAFFFVVCMFALWYTSKKQKRRRRARQLARQQLQDDKAKGMMVASSSTNKNGSNNKSMNKFDVKHVPLQEDTTAAATLDEEDDMELWSNAPITPDRARTVLITSVGENDNEDNGDDVLMMMAADVPSNSDTHQMVPFQMSNAMVPSSTHSSQLSYLTSGPGSGKNSPDFAEEDEDEETTLKRTPASSSSEISSYDWTFAAATSSPRNIGTDPPARVLQSNDKSRSLPENTIQHPINTYTMQTMSSPPLRTTSSPRIDAPQQQQNDTIMSQTATPITSNTTKGGVATTAVTPPPVGSPQRMAGLLKTLQLHEDDQLLTTITTPSLMANKHQMVTNAGNSDDEDDSSWTDLLNTSPERGGVGIGTSSSSSSSSSSDNSFPPQSNKVAVEASNSLDEDEDIATFLSRQSFPTSNNSKPAVVAPAAAQSTPETFTQANTWLTVVDGGGYSSADGSSSGGVVRMTQSVRSSPTEPVHIRGTLIPTSVTGSGNHKQSQSSTSSGTAAAAAHIIPNDGDDGNANTVQPPASSDVHDITWTEFRVQPTASTEATADNALELPRSTSGGGTPSSYSSWTEEDDADDISSSSSSSNDDADADSAHGMVLDTTHTTEGAVDMTMTISTTTTNTAGYLGTPASTASSWKTASPYPGNLNKTLIHHYDSIDNDEDVMDGPGLLSSSSVMATPQKQSTPPTAHEQQQQAAISESWNVNGTTNNNIATTTTNTTPPFADAATDAATSPEVTPYNNNTNANPTTPPFSDAHSSMPLSFSSPTTLPPAVAEVPPAILNNGHNGTKTMALTNHGMKQITANNSHSSTTTSSPSSSPLATSTIPSAGTTNVMTTTPAVVPSLLQDTEQVETLQELIAGVENPDQRQALNELVWSLGGVFMQK